MPKIYSFPDFVNLLEQQRVSDEQEYHQKTWKNGKIMSFLASTKSH